MSVKTLSLLGQSADLHQYVRRQWICYDNY